MSNNVLDEYLKKDCKENLAVVIFQGKTYLGIPKESKIENAMELSGKITKDGIKQWIKDFNVSMTTDIEIKGQQNYVIKKLTQQQKSWLNMSIETMIHAHKHSVSYLENDIFDRLNGDEEEEDND
jgi:hypothetical protein